MTSCCVGTSAPLWTSLLCSLGKVSCDPGSTLSSVRATWCVCIPLHLASSVILVDVLDDLSEVSVGGEGTEAYWGLSDDASGCVVGVVWCPGSDAAVRSRGDWLHPDIGETVGVTGTVSVDLMTDSASNRTFGCMVLGSIIEATVWWVSEWVESEVPWLEECEYSMVRPHVLG